PLTEKRSMRVLYLSSLIISVMGMLIAIAMINVKSALDAWWKLASIFSGGMLGLFLLAAFTHITKAPGALLGTIAGLLIIIWMSLTPMFFPHSVAGRLHNFLVIVFSTITIFFVGFIASWLLKKR